MKIIINSFFCLFLLLLTSRAENIIILRESETPTCDLDSTTDLVVSKGDVDAYYCLKYSLSDTKRVYIKENKFFYLLKFAVEGNTSAYLDMYNLLMSFYEEVELNGNKAAVNFANYFKKKGSDNNINNVIDVNITPYKLSYNELDNFMYNNYWRFSGEETEPQVYFFYSLVMAFKYNYADAYMGIYDGFLFFYDVDRRKIPTDIENVLLCLLKRGALKGSKKCEREFHKYLEENQINNEKEYLRKAKCNKIIQRK